MARDRSSGLLADTMMALLRTRREWEVTQGSPSPSLTDLYIFLLLLSLGPVGLPKHNLAAGDTGLLMISLCSQHPPLFG